MSNVLEHLESKEREKYKTKCVCFINTLIEERTSTLELMQGLQSNDENTEAIAILAADIVDLKRVLVVIRGS